MSLLIKIIFVTSLLWTCDKPDPIITPDPPNVEDSLIEIQWATRMDIEKEIVGTDNTQIYKDWVLTGGDFGDPPILMAFNKVTGNKDWEYVHDGVLYHDISNSIVVDNIYIAITGNGVMAINLDSQTSIWEHKLSDMNLFVHKGYSIVRNGDYIYVNTTWNFPHTNAVFHLLRFHYLTGEIDWVLTLPPDDVGNKGISPINFWEHPNTGEQLAIFNIYENVDATVEESIQSLVVMNLETGEVFWKTEVTDTQASDPRNPPVIFNNSIVITGGDANMYGFDIYTGEQLWCYEFDYPWGVWGYTEKLIYEDKLYVNCSQEEVSCLNPSTGELIWSNPKGGPNCTFKMHYYQDMLVFTSWGYGSIMVLDAFTGETLHREHRYDNSSYNNDVAYDAELDMFFTSTYKHAIGFKIIVPD